MAKSGKFSTVILVLVCLSLANAELILTVNGSNESKVQIDLATTNNIMIGIADQNDSHAPRAKLRLWDGTPV